MQLLVCCSKIRTIFNKNKGFFNGGGMFCGVLRKCAPVTPAGRCYLEKGDVGNADIHYRRCLETSERNIDALLGMAVACYLKKDAAYANGYINQAQAAEPVLNEGMAGVEKLEQAGYSFTAEKKEILAKIFAQMK